MAAGLRFVCLLAAVSLVCSDLYLHNPRGSNNRLNERSANRRNANRMFDSQNNNRGGYNAGDQNTDAFNNEEEIYYMKYFQSGSVRGQESELVIEWTNQHGCGGNQDNDPHKLNCNLVLQYMLQEGPYEGEQSVDNSNEATRLRNGASTNTQDHSTPQDSESYEAFLTRRGNQVHADRGLHESLEYYDDCTTRRRNMNLFHADQRLRGESAKYTRQNPNGNRRGYECPEERDYYPYWHPNPWRDIAVLTDNLTHCDMYQEESFNQKPRYYCRERYNAPITGNSGERKHWSRYNDETTCVANGGQWYMEYGYIDIDMDVLTPTACDNLQLPEGYATRWHQRWNDTRERCLILPPKPECIQAGWSRVNHLGNGRDGVALNYTWKLPYFRGNQDKLAVLRMRYNISTDDYHPWQTNSSHDENRATGRRSPVEQNPNVNIGSTTNKPLRLAINTAQFGRTFQDRSHVMVLRSRSNITMEAARGRRIHNVNVRGKRGNIVQTFPSVEYDFIPNRLTINTSQCVHFQWTGSNTHNNGAPGGDGQTGDAGEGTGGTDRHNIVEIPHANSNYPLPVDMPVGTGSTPMGGRMFKDATLAWASFSERIDIDASNLEIAFGSAGYYHCINPDNRGCTTMSLGSRPQLDRLLNDAPASFEGALLCFDRAGVYHYISSRNNNFTNRSQKGMLTVKEA